MWEPECGCLEGEIDTGEGCAPHGCPDGFYQKFDGECEACGENCARCSDTGYCLECVNDSFEMYKVDC